MPARTSLRKLHFYDITIDTVFKDENIYSGYQMLNAPSMTARHSDINLDELEDNFIIRQFLFLRL